MIAWLISRLVHDTAAIAEPKLSLSYDSVANKYDQFCRAIKVRWDMVYMSTCDSSILCLFLLLFIVLGVSSVDFNDFICLH